MKFLNYPPAISDFFTLGDPQFFLNLPELGTISKYAAHVPELLRLSVDFGLLEMKTGENSRFAPVYAWQTLGKLNADNALNTLFSLLFAEHNDQVCDHLPRSLALFPFYEFKKNLSFYWKNHNWFFSAHGYHIIADTLVLYAENPENSKKVIEFAMGWLQNPLLDNISINACIAKTLSDIFAKEYFFLIYELFMEEEIDEEIFSINDFLQTLTNFVRTSKNESLNDDFTELIEDIIGEILDDYDFLQIQDVPLEHKPSQKLQQVFASLAPERPQYSTILNYNDGSLLQRVVLNRIFLNSSADEFSRFAEQINTLSTNYIIQYLNLQSYEKAALDIWNEGDSRLLEKLYSLVEKDHSNKNKRNSSAIKKTFKFLQTIMISLLDSDSGKAKSDWILLAMIAHYQQIKSLEKQLVQEEKELESGSAAWLAVYEFSRLSNQKQKRLFKTFQSDTAFVKSGGFSNLSDILISEITELFFELGELSESFIQADNETEFPEYFDYPEDN